MLFTQLAGQLSRRSIVIVVSDFLAAPDDIISGLQQLRFSNREVIAMHVLDQDERAFRFTDNTLFEGLEDADQTLLVDPQALRSAYLDALNAHVHQLRAACTNSRIEFIELSTADSLDVALRTYLAARMHLTKAGA